MGGRAVLAGLPQSAPPPAPMSAPSLPPSPPQATPGPGPGAGPGAQAAQPMPVVAYPPRRNVVLVILDGVRQQELYGKSLDDNGKPVRSSELLPNITALRKSGLFFPRMRISNPAGVSLPAYADIFAGRRQERILSNVPPLSDFHSHYPTMFQVVKKGLHLGFDGVALHASWTPLCTIAFQPPEPLGGPMGGGVLDGASGSPAGSLSSSMSSAPANQSGALSSDSYGVNSGTPSAQLEPRPKGIKRPPPMPPDEDFYRSCGFQTNATPVQYFKPEVYGGSRSDDDTFLELAQEVPKRHPRLLVVHFVDADEEAHLHTRVTKRTGVPYGIFHYHQALRKDDYLLGRLWALLQADPFYKDNTYLLVTTDHGRDTHPEVTQWSVHGHCVADYGGKRTCSGCSSVFALAVGPGLPARMVKNSYSHTDLAPTITRLLGVQMPTATGKPIREVLDFAHAPAVEPRAPAAPAVTAPAPLPATPTAQPAAPRTGAQTVPAPSLADRKSDRAVN